MKSNDVPFISNTPDDLHCLNVSYMIIARYFDPTFNVEMDEWAQITGFEENKGTWANAGLVWFKKNGYNVKHVTLFDYNAFIKQPETYLIKLDGQEVGQWSIDHSNIPAEVERVKQLLNASVIERREPTMSDIKRYLDNGYLIRIGINTNRLDGRKGFVGHAIVITGYDDTSFTFHDPGLPPIMNRKATYAELEAAWSDPNVESKELDAIKR